MTNAEIIREKVLSDIALDIAWEKLKYKIVTGKDWVFNPFVKQ